VAKGGFDPKEVRRRADERKADVDSVRQVARASTKGQGGEGRATGRSGRRTTKAETTAYRPPPRLTASRSILELGIPVPRTQGPDMAASRSKAGTKDKGRGQQVARARTRRTDEWRRRRVGEAGVNLRTDQSSRRSARLQRTISTDAGEVRGQIHRRLGGGAVHKGALGGEEVLDAIRRLADPHESSRPAEWGTPRAPRTTTPNLFQWK